MWSVCPWFDGSVAADSVLTDPRREATRLGEFVAALHQPAPSDAPCNEFRRGQPIAEFIPRIEANLAPLDASVDVSAIGALLARLADVREWDGPALWLHGDLHSANMIVVDGAISAVIDFGDITSGDPAVDLAVAWMLFDEPHRQMFRDAAGNGYPIDDATWQRGQLWALHFALLYLLHSADNPRFGRMGTDLLATLMA
jgi:aminoglycoside phosphotransferase (APT) family kinase protein